MALGLPGYNQPRVDGGQRKTSGFNYSGMSDWWQKYMQLTQGRFPDWWENRGSIPEGMDMGWMRAIQRWKEDIENINRPTGGGLGGGFGGGGGGSYPSGGGGRTNYGLPVHPYQQLQSQRGTQWLPDMFSQIYGKLGTEQTAHQDWIKGLMDMTRGTMARTTADLSRGLGSHLSRTNVSIPAGADVLARRYLSPMTQTLESQMGYLQQLLKQPQGRLGSAVGLTQQMTPLFDYWRGKKTIPDLSQYWGGGI